MTQSARTGKGPLRAPGGSTSSRIQKLLPHRYPFLLVDRILEMEPGKRVVGIRT